MSLCTWLGGQPAFLSFNKREGGSAADPWGVGPGRLRTSIWQDWEPFEDRGSRAGIGSDSTFWDKLCLLMPSRMLLRGLHVP